MNQHFIEDAFSSARENGRGTLIGFLTCGDPAPRYTPKLANAVIEGGIDILELGIPFSDPIADGPTIQAADVRALSAGTTTEKTFGIVETIKRKNQQIPIILLTYFNLVFRFGIKEFMVRANESGVSGIVTPDLPVDEDVENYRSTASKNNIAAVLLATPTTPQERLSLILRETRGFLYLVSLLGVTGARKTIRQDAITFVRDVAKAVENNSSAPIAVGFGISKPDHVKTFLKAGADGAIVGSAFVNVVANNLGDVDTACKQLTKFARALRAATIS